jgi:hypothetical protein
MLGSRRFGVAEVTAPSESITLLMCVSVPFSDDICDANDDPVVTAGEFYQESVAHVTIFIENE